MSFESKTPGQSEIEFEHRSSFDISDADWSDSSQQSPAALNHSSSEDSEALSSPSGSPNSLPNTHDAAPSTRRSWMASERRLAASLDHLDAKDLAVHLYNAFALSQRAKTIKSRNEANNGVNEHVWNPPKLWTAWPLDPAIVPAEDEGLQWENESYLNGPSSSKKFTPREALEDILIGRLQKGAKERFLKLSSQDGSPEILDMNLDEDEKLDLLEPVVMADDDLARNLTQPVIHHVLAKLDQLLMALHHARYAYAATEDSASRLHDEVTDREIQQKRKPKHQSVKNGPGSSKSKSKTSNNLSASKADSDLSGSEQPFYSAASNVERSDAKSQRATRPIRHKRKYGLRDWSDVIGVASMTSWEPKTVQRTAIRCASLFDEGIKFRTLEENGTVGNEISILPNSRTEQTESNPLSGGISSKPQDQAQNQNHNHDSAHIPKPRRPVRDRQGSRYYCPVADCNRSSEGFSTASLLRRHLKGVHKQLRTQSAAALYENNENDENVVDDDDEMVGGVHVDGFLQPVPMPESWVYKSKARARSRAKAKAKGKATGKATEGEEKRLRKTDND